MKKSDLFSYGWHVTQQILGLQIVVWNGIQNEYKILLLWEMIDLY